MALFIPLSAPLMGVERASAASGAHRGPEGWTIEGAEALLRSLRDVVSVRIVAKPGGEVQEIHLLTTGDVGAKQTVRNVESALLAHFDLEVDHRKISVARSDAAVGNGPDSGFTDGGAGPAVLERHEGGAALRQIPPGDGTSEGRILFVGHSVASERSHRVRLRVTVEWNGERYEGEAVGMDMPRARLETVAGATLRAIELAMREGLNGEDPKEKEKEKGKAKAGDGFTLALDGVKLIDAFERKYVLVAVHAITGRDVVPLAGAATVEDAADRSVILAALQATDRWVRGRV